MTDNGDVYVVDTYNHRVLVVDHASGLISNVAGVGGTAGYSGDHGKATSASLNYPYDMALYFSDGGQNLYISDTQNNRIRMVSGKTGVISTFAGTGQQGFAGDTGPAALAKLWLPHGLVFDSNSNLFFADYGNNRIRKISLPSNGSTSVITTVAGSGAFGSLGDNGPATSCQLYNPLSVAVDKSLNLFIADTYNHRVRVVLASTGMIYTLVGTGRPGFVDNCFSLAAQLNVPTSLFVEDTSMDTGNVAVWLTDLENNRIRRAIFFINSTTSLVQAAATAVVTTVIGSSLTTTSFGTDSGGAATGAVLRGPNGVFVDANGNVVFADTFSNSIRSARSLAPSVAPTFRPSQFGQTVAPSSTPTRAPTQAPSSKYPTIAPTTSKRPTARPTARPTTIAPSKKTV